MIKLLAVSLIVIATVTGCNREDNQQSPYHFLSKYERSEVYDTLEQNTLRSLRSTLFRIDRIEFRSSKVEAKHYSEISLSIVSISEEAFEPRLRVTILDENGLIIGESNNIIHKGTWREILGIPLTISKKNDVITLDLSAEVTDSKKVRFIILSDYSSIAKKYGFDRPPLRPLESPNQLKLNRQLADLLSQ